MSLLDIGRPHTCDATAPSSRVMQGGQESGRTEQCKSIKMAVKPTNTKTGRRATFPASKTLGTIMAAWALPETASSLALESWQIHKSQVERLLGDYMQQFIRSCACLNACLSTHIKSEPQAKERCSISTSAFHQPHPSPHNHRDRGADTLSR